MIYYSAAAFRRTQILAAVRERFTAIDIFRLPAPEEAVKFIILNFKTVY